MTSQYPMRLRVVDNERPFYAPHLVIGSEVVARGETGEDGDMYDISTFGGGYYKSRFKPVVRVKMGRAVA